MTMLTLCTYQPTYDSTRSYKWNYDNGPVFDGPLPPPDTAVDYSFLDSSLISPLGVAAGVLLNSTWVELYAAMGFGILTYNTVRSRQYLPHPWPNILVLAVDGQLTPDRFNEVLVARDAPFVPIEKLSVTYSFGMPSTSPDVWRRDIVRAKSFLSAGQILVVSVAGTAETTTGLDGLANDFALCARWAVEGGADIVEANFSCPNARGHEDSVYEDPDASAFIARVIREEIGSVPLLIKVGHFASLSQMESVVARLIPYINGITAIDSIPMQVVGEQGDQALLGGSRSGVSGASLRTAGLKTVERLCELRSRLGSDFSIIGVGGVMQPSDVKQYIVHGADAVESAIGAIWDPYLAWKAKFQLRHWYSAELNEVVRR